MYLFSYNIDSLTLHVTHTNKKRHQKNPMISHQILKVIERVMHEISNLEEKFHQVRYTCYLYMGSILEPLSDLIK